MTRLTIGMAVYDDYDGLYFTIQANRLIHQDEMDLVEFLILDNHPVSSISSTLRSLASQVPRCRYVPFGGYASTAVRDLIFREATTDYVLCVDSHVLLLPGSVRALLEYFDAHPGCRDLVQGPMCSESMTGEVATHYRDQWGGGMWGQWASDPRGQDPSAEPFEITMQGMGLFACRREAWPGMNPRMRGHGGEEGYLHEKFRRAGGRVVCHPGVRWLHRSFHSRGLLYPALWRDRARNYVLAFDELGWESTGLERHLHELFDEGSPGAAEDIVKLAHQEATNPYAFFDAVFCLHRDPTRERWERAGRAFAELGIDWLVEPVLASSTTEEDQVTHRDRVLRSITAAARQRGLVSILILEDHLIPPSTSLETLRRFAVEHRQHPWTTRYLADGPGGGESHEAAGIHALAIHHTAYDRILASDRASLPLDQIHAWLHHTVPDSVIVPPVRAVESHAG